MRWTRSGAGLHDTNTWSSGVRSVRSGPGALGEPLDAGVSDRGHFRGSPPAQALLGVDPERMMRRPGLLVLALAASCVASEADRSEAEQPEWDGSSWIPKARRSLSRAASIHAGLHRLRGH